MIPRPDRMGGGGRRPLPPPGPSSRIQKGGYPPGLRAVATGDKGAPGVLPNPFWYGLAIGSWVTTLIWLLIMLLTEAR